MAGAPALATAPAFVDSSGASAIQGVCRSVFDRAEENRAVGLASL
jgi:hypothetical protein